MSLTDELKNSNSWVRAFLDNRFRRLNSWVRHIGADVKSSDLLLPLRMENKRSAATVGKAFDYRLRLHFGWRPTGSRVLRDGIALLGWQLGEPAERQRRLQGNARELLSAALPAGEGAMARAAVILAWLDDAYRRNPPRDGVRRVAARLAGGAPPTWEDCAADVEDSLAREVRGLMEVAEREFGAVDRVGAIGPEFVGSPYVRGADADLLLDHRLVEVKTTIRPGRELLRASRQMLGYILLDWSDEHEMEGAGFYFARQGELVSWPLSSLLEETTGDSTATVKALRLEFRQLAEKAGVQRRRGPRGSIPEAP